MAGHRWLCVSVYLCAGAHTELRASLILGGVFVYPEGSAAGGAGVPVQLGAVRMREGGCPQLCPGAAVGECV